MMKFALTTFAAVALAGPALAETPINFTYEGHQIVGTVSQIGDTQVLKGEDRTSGRAFELRVKKGYVTGVVGGQLVSYPVPRHKVSAPATIG